LVVELEGQRPRIAVSEHLIFDPQSRDMNRPARSATPPQQEAGSMSDVVTKRRPMIDLDEFEKRLSPPSFTDQKDGDPLADLIRIISDKVEPHMTVFEPKAELSAQARQDTGETGAWKQTDAQMRQIASDFAAIEAGLLGTKQPQAAVLRDAERSSVVYKRPNARVPLIGGDFAAIEAGLLGASREQATATVSEADASNVLPSVDPRAERWLPHESQPASSHDGDADGQIKSRRPLYAMVAIIIAGMAGIAMSFGLNSRDIGAPEIATIKAESGVPTPQVVTATDVDIPAHDVAILSKPPEPSPVPIVDGTARVLDVPQAAETSPPAGSQAQIDNGLPAVPPAPAQAPTPTEPLRTAVSVESDTVKTDLVGSDGTLIPNDVPPQATINGAPPLVPQTPMAANVPMAKVRTRVAKPLKPAAARHPVSHGQPRQVANNGKAVPVSPVTTEPAASADPKTETQAAQPSPATNGAFGFVQSAVNSLTNTTAKLVEWGRIETGSRP
jgi:hypothetical protein